MSPSNDELHMMGGMMRSPAFLPDAQIKECVTFRDAVRLAWRHRRIKAMTKATFAERCGLYASHVTDYFSPTDTHADGRARRSLPAEKIAVSEGELGNRAITQFLVRQVELTLMEEVLDARKSA